MQPIKDETGNPIELNEIVVQAAKEVFEEKKRESANLIKSFFKKAEELTYQAKTKKRELEKIEQNLTNTLQKIERLRKGDWTVLAENQRQTHVDSERTEQSTE